MADELYDKALHSWLVLSGAIAILENEGLELSQIMHQTGKQENAEAFEALVAALYWAKEEAHQLFSWTRKQEKPEHLPQHSGNAPR